MAEAMSEERLAVCRDLPRLIRRYTWTAAEDAADAIRDLADEVDRLRAHLVAERLAAEAAEAENDRLRALLDEIGETHAEADLGEQMRHRELGVYRLFWHSGGCSVAAVGMLGDGSRWYAPANWTSSEAGGVASADWSPVKFAELIESYQGSRRKRPRKDAP